MANNREEALRQCAQSAEKIMSDRQYAAPEVRDQWLKAKIADYLMRAWQDGYDAGKCSQKRW